MTDEKITRLFLNDNVKKEVYGSFVKFVNWILYEKYKIWFESDPTSGEKKIVYFIFDQLITSFHKP